MDLWVLGLFLLISVVLSFLLVPRLTAGSTAEVLPTVDERREMQPVVSQCGKSIPAIDQILQDDPESVPGAKSQIWPADNLHFFDNTEIVPKLCGPGITSGALDSWRNVEKQWQKQYSNEAVSTDMDNVQGIKKGLYASASKGTHYRPSGDYYNSANDYCKTNTKKFPCPNNWLDVDYKRAPSSADMFIPGLN
jgi:hypothetical protein